LHFIETTFDLIVAMTNSQPRRRWPVENRVSLVAERDND